MLIVHAFETLVIAHMVMGSVGLVSVWIPILGRKGGKVHRQAGLIFVTSMLITGTLAMGIATCTLIAPMATHAHLDGHPVFGDPAMVRAVFGWMMLYLAFLTVNLAWYGLRCVRDKSRRERGRTPLSLLSQAVLLVLSVICLIQGVVVAQPLMIGISMVGLATVATNLRYLYKSNPRRYDWQLEHIKGLVGAGISVYTAFFAFGAVRLLPEMALAPFLWSLPLITGLAIIIYQQAMVRRRFRVPGAAGAV